MWTEKHFDLTEDEMNDIRRKRDMKKARKKFSEMLSSEGQAAMKLAREDTMALIRKPADDQNLSANVSNNDMAQADRQNQKQRKTISFSDAYRKSSGFLMEGDITHVQFPPEESNIVALGGTKLENALEVVENIEIDPEIDTEETNGGLDENAIEETAKRNSVQKCLVWMEVTENETGETDGVKATQA